MIGKEEGILLLLTIIVGLGPVPFCCQVVRFKDDISTTRQNSTLLHIRLNQVDEDAVNFPGFEKEQPLQPQPDGSVSTRGGLLGRQPNRDCPWLHKPFPCHKFLHYRTSDGSCNNLKGPHLGMAFTPYRRLLESDYGDSVGIPRRSNRGVFELPSARWLSTRLTDTNQVAGKGANASMFTVLLMQMGQFIDHDLTHTPAHARDCCSGGNFPRFFDSNICFPIPITRKDPLWKGKRSCMSLSRSIRSADISCSKKVREQTTQITHWLDASNIYGSSSIASAQLRFHSRGLMKTEEGSSAGDPFRGSRNENLPSCTREREASAIKMCQGCSQCFFAGDQRANIIPSLLVMHTVWIREHNRIALGLGFLHPHWNDEKVFQEARRIVVAEYQHIIFNEWLPIILGSDYMQSNHMSPMVSGYSRDYDESIDPRIATEFSSAAFRFGHSLIPEQFALHSPTRRHHHRISVVELGDSFFRPSHLRSSKREIFDELLRGLFNQRGHVFNSQFSFSIRDKLFSALDLVAINIQRGRDHGIRGYYDYLKLCFPGISFSDKWSDMRQFLSTSDIDKLKRHYKSPGDVDLYIGGLMEWTDESSRKGMVGPTFRCIIGDTFNRLKRGDRFFYDINNSHRTKFSLDQLGEIRRISMARIICDNGDHISSIQARSFEQISRSNRELSCSSIPPSINLEKFQQ